MGKAYKLRKLYHKRKAERERREKQVAAKNLEEIEIHQSSNSEPEEMAMTTCAAYGDIKLTNCAAYGEISNNIPNELPAVYETV